MLLLLFGKLLKIEIDFLIGSTFLLGLQGIFDILPQKFDFDSLGNGKSEFCKNMFKYKNDLFFNHYISVYFGGSC